MNIDRKSLKNLLRVINDNIKHHTHDVFVKSGSNAKAGMVPSPGTTEGTSKYLREDGTWQKPPNTTYSDMTGATTSDVGTHGLVPAPSAGSANRYLRSDGTWSVPPDTDTKYTHPTTSGNKHIPSGGSSGQILRWSADGTATWSNDNNTTYTNFVKSGTGAKAGLVPAPSTTAGTSKYLREDGTWTTPPNTNTTYADMKAATANAAGTHGLVPAPAAGNQSKYLRGDGTWQTPTNTTYSNFVKSGSTAKAGLVPSPGTTAGTKKALWEDATWHTIKESDIDDYCALLMPTIAIPKNSDLNTYITPGCYSVQDSTVAATLINTPITNRGFMLEVMCVYASASSLYKTQTIKNYLGYESLRYTMDGGKTWTDWKERKFTDTNTTYTPASATPKANGTAAVGTSAKYAREDHVHPLQTTVSGNAGTATKLATARNINGMSIDGSANRTNYGSCSTAAATAAKVVACTGFKLSTGAEITVKFTVTNTADSPTLNVNSTGAKAIYYHGSAINKAYLAANRTYTFRYNGTQYDLVGDVDTNSTYTAASATPKANGTAAVGSSTKYAREDHVHPTQGSVAKLTTARTITTNLASTTAASFDGSANVTPGVSGILPITNGGTGNDKGFVQVGHLKGIYNDEAIGANATAEGKNTKATGECSHVEGKYSHATALCAHAEGESCDATGDSSHAEGCGSQAKGKYSHAEGDGTYATGDFSHSEGSSVWATGKYSHAGGRKSTAYGMYSFAHGYFATAKTKACTSIGINNKESVDESNLFIIGGGAYDDSTNPILDIKDNCFRVNRNSGAYAMYAFHSSGADYAEMFEWEDGNLDNEDRRGRFVTLRGNKISLTSSDDFILGVVSGDPSVVGDVYDESWNGMYITDIFGRPILEEVTVPEQYEMVPSDDDPEVMVKHVIQEAYTEMRKKLNPNYDPNQTYIPRSERPEWDAVGMIGKLIVVDDGSCEIDGWCKPSKNGIGTKSDERTKFRVMQRLDDNHIQILIL